MSPQEASQILDLPSGAAPDELETRFNELRAKLEDKIAKAPTPGLKAKYRENLDEITVAFETLTLAADASSLPVAKRADAGAGLSAVGGRPSASVNSESAPAAAGRVASPPAESRKPKAKSLEFIFVAMLGLAVFGGGAWWVMKTRAEKAEAARVADEQKAEAERRAAAALAEKERLAAIARAEEEARKIAEEQERQRRERELSLLRAQLAEFKIAWEATENELRTAERNLAEHRSDLRGMRDATPGRLAEARATVEAHQALANWLRETLSRHPLKLAQARAEELIAGRQVEEAKASVSSLAAGIETLGAEIRQQTTTLLSTTGEIAIECAPTATWTIEDAFGSRHEGRGPGAVSDVAIGQAKITVHRMLAQPHVTSVNVPRLKRTEVKAIFEGSEVHVDSIPAGAAVVAKDSGELGRTPFTLSGVPAGSHSFTLRLKGYYDEPVSIVAPTERQPAVKLRPRSETLERPTWRYPDRFTFEQKTQAQGQNRAGDTVTPISLNTASTERWTITKRDEQGRWTSLLREISGTDKAILRYDLVSEGIFQPTVQSGSIANDAVRAAMLNPAGLPTLNHAWIEKCWPPAGSGVGATWSVSKTDFPWTAHANRSSQATGRLVAFDREAQNDFVTLEYSFSSGDHHSTLVMDKTGTIRVRVNLGHGYVERTEMRMNDVTRATDWDYRTTTDFVITQTIAPTP